MRPGRRGAPGIRPARLVTMAIALLLMTASCGGPTSESPQPSGVPTSTSASTSPSDRPPVTDIAAGGAEELDIVGDFLTVSDDAVWIAGKNSRGMPEFYRLAPSDGKVVASVPLPNPGD